MKGGELNDQSFWQGATFMPHDQPRRIDSLLEQASKRRLASLMALRLLLSVKEPDLIKLTGCAERFSTFDKLPADAQRQFTDLPLFAIWLKLGLVIPDESSPEAATQRADLRRRLLELNRIMTDFMEHRNTSTTLKLEGTSVEIGRFNLDPLITEVASPGYDFPAPCRQQEFEREVFYPLSYFLESVRVALERIKHAWPAAYRDFCRFVKLIVNMVDAKSESISEYKYPGVIYIATDNFSMLKLEESLIHEFGHQLLLKVMELDPLIQDASGETYKLPWSGNERDFYGYFHAFYIYLLLVQYFNRVKARSRQEQMMASARASQIVNGLLRAIPELEAADRFTARGKHLFANLKAEVLQMAATHG